MTVRDRELETAQRRLQVAGKLIARQRVLVLRLTQAGLPNALALALLEQMERSRDQMQTRLDNAPASSRRRRIW